MAPGSKCELTPVETTGLNVSPAVSRKSVIKKKKRPPGDPKPDAPADASKKYAAMCY